MKFHGNYRVSLVSITRHGLEIQSGNQSEAKIQDVKKQKEEKESARNALKKVKPVSRIRIVQSIRPCFARDYDPVHRVKQQWQKDPEYLDEDEIGHVVNVLHVIIEHLCSAHRGGIGINMNEVEQSKRDYAGQLMQFAQKKNSAEFDRHPIVRSKLSLFDSMNSKAIHGIRQLTCIRFQ